MADTNEGNTPEVIDFSSGKAKAVSATPEEVEKLLGNFRDVPMTVDTPVNQTVTAPAPGQKLDPKTHFVRGPKRGQVKPTGYPVTGARPPVVQVQPNPNDMSTVTGEIITGALLLMLTDILIPGLIVVINNQFSKDKIDIEKLQMNEKQKKTLEPVADKVAYYIKISANPLVIYLIANIGIYGLNFLMLKQLSKKPK